MTQSQHELQQIRLALLWRNKEKNGEKAISDDTYNSHPRFLSLSRNGQNLISLSSKGIDGSNSNNTSDENRKSIEHSQKHSCPLEQNDRGAKEEEEEEWIEYWDEEVGASYYYNAMTGEASWVGPNLS